MRCANEYIEFEIETRTNPFRFLGVPADGDNTSTSNTGDDEYPEATEDDINDLARFLGGF